MLRRLLLPAVLAALLPACSNDDALVLADAADDAAAAATVKQMLVTHAADLHDAAVALQDAAPKPGPAGWSEATDPDAVHAMRDAWKRADLAYRWLEGAVEVYFPDAEDSLDARFEDALALGSDPDLFDGQGFVGLHAVERILWADAKLPASVAAFEASLMPGAAPSFPTNFFQAQEFHDKLCNVLVQDTASLQSRIAALSLDSPDAYETAVHLVKGQLTKVEDAGAGKDLSRYANFTLADMRANLAAAEATHAAFHRWLLSKQDGGSADDSAVEMGFAQLVNAYGYIQGDGLPSPPAGWSSVDPTTEMIGTSAFGGLWAAVSGQVNETSDGSLLSAMGKVFTELGIAPSTAPDGGTDAGTSGGLPPDPT